MQGNPVSMVTKSKVIITSSSRDTLPSRVKVFELAQSFGDVQSLKDIAADESLYSASAGYICDYYDIRAAPQAVTGLNGITIGVSESINEQAVAANNSEIFYNGFSLH
jgi:hypothetical protein